MANNLKFKFTLTATQAEKFNFQLWQLLLLENFAGIMME
jgi:hypothetical protein